MINKLFNLALSYINKKEEGVRFRTAVVLGIYTVAFGGAYILGFGLLSRWWYTSDCMITFPYGHLIILSYL